MSSANLKKELLNLQDKLNQICYSLTLLLEADSSLIQPQALMDLFSSILAKMVLIGKAITQLQSTPLLISPHILHQQDPDFYPRILLRTLEIPELKQWREEVSTGTVHVKEPSNVSFGMQNGDSPQQTMVTTADLERRDALTLQLMEIATDLKQEIGSLLSGAMAADFSVKVFGTSNSEVDAETKAASVILNNEVVSSVLAFMANGVGG